MAQFLVAQRAVVGVQEGEADFPSESLDRMQDRFMVYGSRSPVEWALKLRAFGRGVQDQRTAQGFILWSDNGENISFKGAELNITSLRWFLRDQVEAVQALLEKLLLVSPFELREDVVPSLDIRQLKDDASIDAPNWSFLDDPRNAQLLGNDAWLLRRMLNTDGLKDQFIRTCHSGSPKWRPKAAAAYLELAISFLGRLLLVIHLTSGQPARGTELLCIQWRNAQAGFRRTINVENGLVSLVNSSIKGYSMEGSTKIIHRYLPFEVSEMLVYYLWLVEPFCRQLRILALGSCSKLHPHHLPPLDSALLWGTKEGKPWSTDQLRDVLAREFEIHLNCSVNVATWRHIAIAMSRRHISGKSFKRDYDNSLQITADEQAGHTPLIAGNIYGRLISAAPGYVQAAQAQYRVISLRWHKFLRFGISLPPRTVQTITKGTSYLFAGHSTSLNSEMEEHVRCTTNSKVPGNVLRGLSDEHTNKRRKTFHNTNL